MRTIPDNLIQVGTYRQEFNSVTGQSLPCAPIYQSLGLQIHVQKRHPAEIGNLALIPQIIQSPDYIGKNPKEPDSIELVKVFQNNVMVCIKLDHDNGYFYVATVFEINSSKLQNRISSGRLKPAST